MYPITAGGFQTNSGATPQLRQGNMVFGFFLDGQDQQVPVIMGVLGNNSQTQLSQVIGDDLLPMLRQVVLQEVDTLLDQDPKVLQPKLHQIKT